MDPWGSSTGVSKLLKRNKFFQQHLGNCILLETCGIESYGCMIEYLTVVLISFLICTRSDVAMLGGTLIPPPQFLPTGILIKLGEQGTCSHSIRISHSIMQDLFHLVLAQFEVLVLRS